MSLKYLGRKPEPFLFNQAISDAKIEELLRRLDERAVSFVELDCQCENDRVLGRYAMDLRRHSFITLGRRLGGGAPLALFLLGYQRRISSNGIFRFSEPKIEFTVGQFLPLHEAEDRARQPLLEKMDAPAIAAFKGRIAKAREHRGELLTLMQQRTHQGREELFRLLREGISLSARELKERGFATEVIH